jgi:hypothetical protein
MLNGLQLFIYGCQCYVFRRSDNSVAFKGVLKGKLYLIDFSNEFE